MKKRLLLACAFSACISCQLIADPVTITIDGTLAPNIFGSPSFSAWEQNEFYALQNGLSTYGAAGPTQFNAISTAPVSQNIATGFPSWLGQADPGTAFGPAYANELGNRATFGLFINGNGNKISISELSFSATSTDPGNNLGFAFGPSSYNYSQDYVGLIYGPGGSVTQVTSGPNTQLVDAIVGRGSGNTYAAYETDPGATDQDKINGGLAGIGPYDFTGGYDLTDNTGAQIATASDTITFTSSVPDHVSTASIFGLAMIGLVGFRRRLQTA